MLAAQSARGIEYFYRSILNDLELQRRAVARGGRTGDLGPLMWEPPAPEVELPEVEKGLIPDPKWKRITHGEGWSTGDTYIASVGQGLVTATPLQILMSGATIANYGKLMQPLIVREVQDSEGHVLEMWFDPSDFSIYEVRETTSSRGEIDRDEFKRRRNALFSGTGREKA